MHLTNPTLIKNKRARWIIYSLSFITDDASQSAVITNAKQNIITSTNLFCFAWVAFHPDTEVYKLNN